MALLQECRPGDFEAFARAWAQEEYRIVGSIPQGWTACSAVPARRDYDPTFVSSDDHEWFRFFSGHLVRATLKVPGLGPLSVASVHTVAKEVDGPCVDEDGHQRLKRTTVERAWHCDLAAGALRSWVGTRFIVGGDWNTALGDDRSPT